MHSRKPLTVYVNVMSGRDLALFLTRREAETYAESFNDLMKKTKDSDRTEIVSRQYVMK